MAQTLKHGFTYDELLTALPRSGCPICRVRSEHLERFFFWFKTENYSAPDLVKQLTEASGLCAIHARVLMDSGRQYVGSVVAQYILVDARQKLEQTQAALSAVHPRRRRPASKTPVVCPVCAQAAEDDDLLARAWVEALDVPEFRDKLATSTGLCLPHLRQVLSDAPDQIAHDLLQTQIAWLHHLEAELAEYFRKTDYRFAAEPKGPEQTAWQRALEWLSGWPLDRLTEACEAD